MPLEPAIDAFLSAPSDGPVTSRVYYGLELLLFLPFVVGVALAGSIMGLGDCAGSVAWAGICNVFVVYTGLTLTVFPVGLVAYAAVEEELGAAFDAGTGVDPLVVAGLCLLLVYPALLLLDVRRVRAMDVDWDPSLVWYPLVGYVVPGLVVLHYLSRRHKHVPADAASDRWWPTLLFAVSLVVLGFCLAPVLGAAALAVGILGFALSAAAVYKDAAFLRAHAGWDGNPVNSAAGALFTALVPPLWLGYVGYYTYRRRGVVAEASV